MSFNGDGKTPLGPGNGTPSYEDLLKKEATELSPLEYLDAGERAITEEMEAAEARKAAETADPTALARELETLREQYRAMLELAEHLSPTLLLVLDANGNISECTARAGDLVSANPNSINGQHINTILSPASIEPLTQAMATISQAETPLRRQRDFPIVELSFMIADQEGSTAKYQLQPVYDTTSVTGKLSGFLILEAPEKNVVIYPICSSCKQVRFSREGDTEESPDDTGNWQPVEIYIREETGGEASHGLCPCCAKKLYGIYYGPTTKLDIVDVTNLNYDVANCGDNTIEIVFADEGNPAKMYILNDPKVEPWHVSTRNDIIIQGLSKKALDRIIPAITPQLTKDKNAVLTALFTTGILKVSK